MNRHMDETQARLIAGARSFDRQVLEQIYDLHSPELYRYAYRLLGRQDTAEECVGEAFAHFLEALQKGKGPRENLRAYLFRTTHNICTDTYRRQPLQEDLLDDNLNDHTADQPQFTVEQAHERREVRLALFNLTAEQRQVIVLRFLEGWQNEEVAAILKKTVGAIKALQHRALASLRRDLVSVKRRI